MWFCPFWHFREFRPLDTLHFLVSPVSHPYRGNTTAFDGSLVVAWFLFGVFGCFVSGLAVWVWLWSCAFFPSLCSVSYPSMMTWALRPHGVRTCGEKKKKRWRGRLKTAKSSSVKGMKLPPCCYQRTRMLRKVPLPLLPSLRPIVTSKQMRYKKHFPLTRKEVRRD